MAAPTTAGPWLRTGRLVAVALTVSAVWACSAPAPDPAAPAAASPAGGAAGAGSPGATTAAPDGTITPRPSAPASPTSSPSVDPTPSPKPTPRLLVSDGRPRAARLSIPALDIEDLRVEPHRGSPDDARGTRIQDRGIAASPHGPDGGVGPGGIGNHIITAHRLSSTRAFLDLPDLRVGQKVQLEAGGRRYTYRITRTRITSFRSAKSLAAQSAPVPGRPGERATRAMITLSTCRTPEDRAEGNDWSDEFGNPENRIDKIGELVAVDAV